MNKEREKKKEKGKQKHNSIAADRVGVIKKRRDIKKKIGGMLFE
jgi:hypothetical protein